MRTIIAFSVTAAVATSAWARPDHDHVPPGAFRSETQMRMPVDGRADTMVRERPNRPDPWEHAAKPAEHAPSAAQSQLPLKSEVAQKAQQGDHREVAAKPQALDAKAQPQQPASDRMGRPEVKPALPLKTEIAIQAQHGGDSREASSSSSSPNAKPDDKRAKNPQQAPPPRLNMTAHDRQMLCRQAGVCLPQSVATDDVEDKTE
jgi:hypothetical protein